MRPVDLYKLLFQASMGPAHAVADIAAAKERLNEEMSSAAEGPEEPLVDPISPCGELVRIHIRSWCRTGLPGTILLKAFTDTARDFCGSRRTLEEWCSDLLIEGTEFRIEASRLLWGLTESNFPPMHHSSQYRTTYSPAYRIVLRKHLPAAICGRGNA